MVIEADLRNAKWTINPDFEIIPSEYIGRDEQECHFNIMLEGIDGTAKPQIIVSCSNTIWITKLSKSPLFTLTRAYITKTGFINNIDGTLHPKGLSLKTKLRAPRGPPKHPFPKTPPEEEI